MRLAAGCHSTCDLREPFVVQKLQGKDKPREYFLVSNVERVDC